jgi:hypothetical protein
MTTKRAALSKHYTYCWNWISDEKIAPKEEVRALLKEHKVTEEQSTALLERFWLPTYEKSLVDTSIHVKIEFRRLVDRNISDALSSIRVYIRLFALFPSKTAPFKRAEELLLSLTSDQKDEIAELVLEAVHVLVGKPRRRRVVPFIAVKAAATPQTAKKEASQTAADFITANRPKRPARTLVE